MTEFQRKTYCATIEHISSFIPDDGIIVSDLFNVVRHCVCSMPDNQLDALFNLGSDPIGMPDGKTVNRSALFSRDKKEVAVGMSLLDIFVEKGRENHEN